jgi:hypothetical protein
MLLGMYFSLFIGNPDGKGGELHILNPWNLTTENKTLLKDIYTLLDLKLNIRLKYCCGRIVDQLKEAGYNKG